MQPITVSTTVPIAPPAAFAAFTQAFFAWWPRDYSYSGELVENLVLGGADGALCSEFGPGGFRIDFGRVLTWAPPRRLVIAWQISPDSQPEPDPDRASRLAVEFVAAEQGAEVRLTHDLFERHGEGAAAYAEEMASDFGWPLILQRFRAYVLETRQA